MIRFMQATVSGNKSQFESLEEINKHIQDSLILDNAHSQVSIEV